MCRFELVAGTAVNTNTYGSVNNDYPLDIQIESDGKLDIAGQFAGTNVNVGTPGIPFNLSSNAGNWDGYYNRYDSSFNHLTAFAIGGTNVDASRSILQTGNQIFMAGTYAGTANFNPSGTSNLTSLGQFDVFFSKYNLCGASTPNVTLNRTICNGNAYYFKGANRTTTGTYIDTIKDNNGCDSILTLNLTVSPNSNPTISISTTSSTTICPTASVTFNASVTNAGPNPIYQWRRNASIVGANSSTLTLSNINNNDSIYCVFTAGDSCAIPKVQNSNKIKFTVATNRTHSVVVTSNPALSTFCAGTSVQFTATPTNGGSTPSYQWKKNGFNVGTNSPTWTTTSLANNDSVWCLVSSSDSCASPTDATSNKLKFTINASVTPAATISVNPTGAICAGANASFSVATSSNLGSGPLYQWRKNGALVGTNSTYASTTLTQGDVITLRITSNATCAVPDSVITAPIAMNVNALNTPSVSIAGVNSICVGQNTTFTATPTNGGTAPVYQWKVNGGNVGTNSTTYSSTAFTNGQVVSCEMTSNVTCPSTTKVNSNDITVQVNSLSAPAVSIAGPTTTLCSGQSLTYTATPTNGGSAPAYQWKVNSNNAGTNSSSFTTTLVGGDIVTCVMTSNSACASVPTANSNSLTITSAVTPTISINSPTTSICAGESLTFTASITNGGSNPSLQWFKNGFAVSG
ncbi:MAG: hypothetical protein IPK03_01745 [Bacteroidetes bacterium]|nr:hypothetical protein [Bacteroidota bacterium]